MKSYVCIVLSGIALAAPSFAAQAAGTCSFNGGPAVATPTCTAPEVAFCNPKTQKAECVDAATKAKKQPQPKPQKQPS